MRWPWSRRVVVRPPTGGTVEFPDALSAATYLEHLRASGMLDDQAAKAVEITTVEGGGGRPGSGGGSGAPGGFGPPQRVLHAVDEPRSDHDG